MLNFNGYKITYAKLHEGYFQPGFGPVEATLDTTVAGTKIKSMTKIDGGVWVVGWKDGREYNFNIPDTNFVGQTIDIKSNPKTQASPLKSV